jgi:hypothetical protein
MPAIADLPRPRVVLICPLLEAQGAEGEFLCGMAERATSHWGDRAEEILSDLSGTDDHAMDYDGVPLASAGTVMVRYVFAGDLQPLPYPLDE